MKGEKTPAIFVNLFHMAVGSDGITRIVFSDAIEGANGKERVAVAMSNANAQALGKMIADVMAQHVKNQTEAEEAAKT